MVKQWPASCCPSTDTTVAKEARRCSDFHLTACSMNRRVMTSCCTFCTQTAYTAHAVTRFPAIKHRTAGGGQSFRTTAAANAARSLTCLLAHSSGRPVIAVPRLCSFSVASLKAPQPCTWPTNWASIAPICSRDDMRFTRSSQRIFPPPAPLSDPVTEADELYQNAGEKGRKHADPSDPPRHRANKARGHGTWASDRPPIVGIVGRCSGHIRLRLCQRADRAT